MAEATQEEDLIDESDFKFNKEMYIEIVNARISLRDANIESIPDAEGFCLQNLQSKGINVEEMRTKKFVWK